MVGEFAASGSLPANQPLPAEFASGFKQIREISPDYFTLETLAGQHPDFLFAGWNYGLQTGTTLTPDNLAKYGIKTLALTESCAHAQTAKQSVSVDDTYQDLTDLGQIFGIPQRAQQVINSMKAQVATAQSKVASIPPVTVFDYDSGTSAPVTGPGLAMPTAEISLGGGTNIFAGLKQSWTTVSWEQVVKANPSVHHHQRLQHPHGCAKRAVPGNQLHHQEPHGGEEPLLPAPHLRRSHSQPPQRRSRRSHRPLAPPVRLRPGRRRVVNTPMSRPDTVSVLVCRGCCCGTLYKRPGSCGPR
jgi:hypothetical protein